MANPSFLDQLFARDPRRLVRFPDIPLEAALAELRILQEKASGALARNSTPPIPVSTPPTSSATNENLDAGLCALATHVWRTKGKLVDVETGEPKEETRRIYRHVEAALDSFAQMGVTLNDWIGQPYDPGLPVKVLTFQPTEGVTRDTVVEAVRPTVVWKDRLLQLGEVVVGIASNSEKAP